MKTSEALEIVQSAWMSQIQPLTAADRDSPLVHEVVEALRKRLSLAETALSRSDGITIQRWEPKLPQLYIIIRSHLRRDELAEWNRLAQVISKATTREPTA